MADVMRWSVAGEELTLLPQRALWWEAKRTLFVADVHLGKAAAFRSQGAWMPEGANSDDLPALDALVERWDPLRVVVLGDLWHAKSGRTDVEVEMFQAWCERHRDLETWLVEGNHDRRSGPLPMGCGVREVPENTPLGPFVLRHYPEASPDGYVLAGHLHPGILLQGSGQKLRLPCFWFGDEVAVLPAFGTMTGCMAVSPKRSDRVAVIAGSELLRVS